MEDYEGTEESRRKARIHTEGFLGRKGGRKVYDWLQETKAARDFSKSLEYKAKKRAKSSSKSTCEELGISGALGCRSSSGTF